MTYWVLKVPLTDDGAHLSILPPNGPAAWRYDKGESLINEHPQGEESIICFDSNFSGRVKLYDFVSNVDGVLICSQKVKQVLDDLQCQNIEYLPLWLQDEKKNIVSKDYVIVHVLGSVDIVDMEKSEYVMGQIINDQIKSIDHLVVDHEKIPEESMIFRASSKLNEIFINSDTKTAFDNAGLKGYECFEADDWDGMDF